MTADLRALGASIREARSKTRVGLNVSARELGISATYLSRIETGMQAPSVEILSEIAEAFGVPELLDEWCRLLGKVPPDVAALLERPGAFARLREAYANEALIATFETKEVPPLQHAAPRVRLRIKVYDVVTEAVARGVVLGVRRAHKHGQPTEAVLVEHVEREAINALCEVVDFGELGSER